MFRHSLVYVAPVVGVLVLFSFVFGDPTRVDGGSFAGNTIVPLTAATSPPAVIPSRPSAVQTGQKQQDPSRPIIGLDHSTEVWSHSTEKFTAKVLYDVEKCSGVVHIHRKDAVEVARMEATQFTQDASIQAWVKKGFGPDFFRITFRGPEVVMANITYAVGGHSTGTFFFTQPGEFLMTILLVFDEFKAVNDLHEKTWFDYANTYLAQKQPIQCKTPAADVAPNKPPCGLSQSTAWGRWVANGEDRSDFKKEFPNYWLPLKKYEKPLNDETPDILGRMNYRTMYRWEPYGCSHTKFSKEDALEVLRGINLHFFGDSHLRMTFYGMLNRLGIKFSFDKVWKGDRVDKIASHNCSVAYVASYFLNTSRPTAVDMLMKKNSVILAGVGQHHASACFTLRKHTITVEVCMRGAFFKFFSL